MVISNESFSKDDHLLDDLLKICKKSTLRNIFSHLRVFLMFKESFYYVKASHKFDTISGVKVLFLLLF